MIISEKSIQQVRDASIQSVIGHYLKLNRSNMACCPFHDEKTPSFHVSEKKGMYKCFGCAVSGDIISFVMQHDKLDFKEAIEQIAKLESISLEYEEVADKEKWEAQKTRKQQMHEVLQHTITTYRNNLFYLSADHPVAQYMRDRKLTQKEIVEWQLGWGGVGWRSITPDLINRNWYEPGEALGIIKRSKNDDSNYDGFRSRITIPITNHLGQFIGLAGRWFQMDPADAGKQYAKYINPPENEMYSKSRVLFGLDRAIKSIGKLGFAFLVEGYFDVISMHRIGDTNVVGTCGTALTIDQAKLLKRFTNRVVILRDGDAAGIAAARKDLKILLKEGFKVEIALLPKNEDPDSYVLKLDSYNHPQPMLNGITFDDAIFWQINDLVREAAGDNYQTGLVKQQAVELLATIPNELIRNNYLDNIAKKYKWKTADLQKKLNEIAADEEDGDDEPEVTNLDKAPSWMNREELMTSGYCTVTTKKTVGYYSYGSSGASEITNFIIHPLFHIEAGLESRFLIQVQNRYHKKVLDVQSRDIINVDSFAKYLINVGCFIYGNKIQMLRILTDLHPRFPVCLEVKFLGWQHQGFFAFENKVFIPGKSIMEIDEWGIIKHDGADFLIPPASAAYKELQRCGDDPYENDRYLTYIPAEVSFELWAKQMNRVYLEKGPVGIAYSILTIFRDIIFEVDNNCPHLYGFGERSAGKSKWAESICALFYHKRAAFNLNSGTDFAFFNYMQRFRNCPSQLNEFDEQIIRPEWFQNIKGIYDGEGRQRGVMGSHRRTEIMKIDSTLILTGQFLVTMDDNSIVSRSLIEGFHEREMTDEDKQEYNKLKAWEEKGLSSLLVEVLQHRSEFKVLYRDQFNETLSKWRRNTDGDQNFNQRIMQNWCHLHTCYDIISKKIKLPIESEQFENYCKQKALQWSAFIRSSDTLSEFWNTLAFLVDQGTLVDGWDFKIESAIEVKIRKDRSEVFTHQFAEPTKLLYIRLNNVHKHYQQAYRMRTGKEGMSMENLLHYFSSRKYYIGNSKASQFKRWVTKIENKTHVTPGGSVAVPETRKVEEKAVTSSYVFLYNQLNIEIERSSLDDDENNLPF